MNLESNFLRATDHPQLIKLYALMDAAAEAAPDARKGDLFCSHAGKALVNAAFDLFEVDGLYDLAGDVSHELGEEIPPLPRVTTAVRKLDPSVWGNVDD